MTVGGSTVLDLESEQVLAGILRRESRSLLSYTADAYPWTKAKDEGQEGRCKTRPSFFAASICGQLFCEELIRRDGDSRKA